jgi:hypothetical protein
MIFIWGKKRVRHKEGFVADYCRVCHHVFFGVLLVGIAYTILHMQMQNGRILRGKMCDIIAKALGRLQPSRKELNARLARCKDLGMKIGKKLKPVDLWKTMMRTSGATTHPLPPLDHV